MSELKTYMGYDETAGSAEGAVLIFAHSTREARKIGFPHIRSWFDTEWIDMRARRLTDHVDHLIGEADTDKFAAGIPHVVDDPKVCPTCQLWGGGSIDENGRCDLCYGGDY